jgi:hypothetical protein
MRRGGDGERSSCQRKRLNAIDWLIYALRLRLHPRRMGLHLLEHA